MKAEYSYQDIKKCKEIKNKTVKMERKMGREAGYKKEK